VQTLCFVILFIVSSVAADEKVKPPPDESSPEYRLAVGRAEEARLAKFAGAATGRYVPPPVPWPGIGCTDVSEMGSLTSPHDGLVKATLVGGVYDSQHFIGEFHEGELLPHPWEKWRMVEVNNKNTAAARYEPTTRPGDKLVRRLGPERLMSRYCVIRNEDTGDRVMLTPVWGVWMPAPQQRVLPPTTRPTTRP
jgi:hypothetical protein